MSQFEYKVLRFILRYSEGYSTGAPKTYVTKVSSLTEQMEQTLNEMAADGWRVVSVHSVLRGNYNSKLSGHAGFGYGYSTTDAFVVVLEREGNR